MKCTRQAVWVTGVGCLCALWTSPTNGQEASDVGEVALIRLQQKVTRLSPDAWAGMAKFQVDAAQGERLRFRIRASPAVYTKPAPNPCTNCVAAKPLSYTAIQLPVNPLGSPIKEVRPDNVAQAPYNGSYFEFDGGEGNASLLMLPIEDPGYHYYYEFDSRGPGQYSVILISTEFLVEDVAVITELISESPLAVNLMAVTPRVAVNQPAVLTAMVFDGASAVHNANVLVTAIAPSGNYQTFNLYDTGEPSRGDHLGGDGLYGGKFTSSDFAPGETGEFTVHASITGLRDLAGVGMVAYERDAGASVSVIQPCATLAGPYANYGQDDNNNGLYEWLVIQASGSTAVGSEWILQAVLETTTGKTLLAYGHGTATQGGDQTFQARISSDDIHSLGEPGPYRIVNIELSCVTAADGAMTVGRLAPGSNTWPYRLDQFEPPPPKDCNGNGISDLVEIELGFVEDCNRSYVPDECEPPVPPVLAVDPGQAKNRALSFSAFPPASGCEPGATPVLTAIRVVMEDLQSPVPPNRACCPPPNFGSYEVGTCTAPNETTGCARWVGAPRKVWERQDNPLHGSYNVAQLQCTPDYRNWGCEGVLHVMGPEIMPSSTYGIQVYAESCMGHEGDCADVLCSLTMTTPLWGNVNLGQTQSEIQPDVYDIIAIINKFKQVEGSLSRAVTKLHPNVPNLNTDVEALDITMAIDAFRGLAYPYSGPCPCPSTVTCLATPCTSPVPCAGSGMCIRTCSGGDNADHPCYADYHCPGGTCPSGGFCRDRCGRCQP